MSDAERVLALLEEWLRWQKARFTDAAIHARGMEGAAAAFACWRGAEIAVEQTLDWLEQRKGVPDKTS